MGSSGYLAAKSEQEVWEHEIAIEKEEIRLMPEVEEDELALQYEVKGVDPRTARRMAEEVMRDPERALGEQVREELKIGEAHATPFKEGWVTGVSTRSEEHTSELQSRLHLVCRLLLEKKKKCEISHSELHAN